MNDTAAPRVGFWRRRRSWILGGLAIFVLLLGLLWERCGVRGCPNVERLTSYQPGGATVLLDSDGEQFADLAPVEPHASAVTRPQTTIMVRRMAITPRASARRGAGSTPR